MGRASILDRIRWRLGCWLFTLAGRVDGTYDVWLDTAELRNPPGGPHIFGHHPDDVEPWDALLADVRTLEEPDQAFTSLVAYWRKIALAQEEGDGR